MSETIDDDEVPRPAWRVGEHYGIHVYEGDRPVATFHTAVDAHVAVQAYNAFGKVEPSAPETPGEVGVLDVIEANANAQRAVLERIAVPASSDEPARCEHGKTEAHLIGTGSFEDWCGGPEYDYEVGPAASGTPDGGQR